MDILDRKRPVTVVRIAEPEVERRPSVTERPVSSRPVSAFGWTLRELTPHETFMLLSAFLYSVIAVGASALVTQWPQVVIRMAIVVTAILGMNYWSSNTKSLWLAPLKLGYTVLLLLLFFKSSEFISFPLHGHDFDSLLIASDRFLFGGANPTQWLFLHFPKAPALTEYLTICYSLFYFLPLALAVELYREGQKEETNQVFFICIYGFLLSYVAYFLVPSIGPRFTLHNYFDISSELPGLLLTEPIRTLLNRGENIVPGMPLPEIIRVVTRDAFPSGHSDITLMTIILAFRYRVRLRWPIAILGSSLIFSTVYLRYHYVIDLVGGALLAVITLYTWRTVRGWMMQLNQRLTGTKALGA